MIDILAIGATSPLGRGEAAWSLGAISAPAIVRVMRDARLEKAGLRKPFAARTELDFSGDSATALLRDVVMQVLSVVPRDARVGFAIGTSSGGMATAEKLFAGAECDPAEATYHAPFRAVLSSIERNVARSTHVVTACSASTIAIGLACRWLQSDDVDVAIAGGYDALTDFVAAGFEALGATTASPPAKPFRVGRDGMSLGEGAGVFVLARANGRGLASIAGFGAAGDAVHLTAPDRTGGGLARAAERALAGVDRSRIDLVSVHGTSTAFNDPMESRAVARVLGKQVDVHAGKASIGHTLGAAGVLESALAVDALRRQILPATPGEGELDPEVGMVPREVNAAGAVRAVLKLSAAFGGANAALAIVPSGGIGSVRAKIGARVVAEALVEETTGDALEAIAAASGVPRERLARMDHVSRLALFAVGKLAGAIGRETLAGAGIVLSSVLATIDVNAVYDEGRRRNHTEGRRFAYTTPNASAGECAMAFGLTGPNLAVSRGVDAEVEAEEIARDLIGAGDATKIVVVSVDAAGPMATRVAQTAGWNVRFGARARLFVSAE
ncbi:MAG: beta-ketoacyl synthase N-terminal-like domain-containing protein [Polyangiales bacterium]